MAIASDNVRDQFYAYGDLDMLEVFGQVSMHTVYVHISSQIPSWTPDVLAFAFCKKCFKADSIHLTDITVHACTDLKRLSTV